MPSLAILPRMRKTLSLCLLSLALGMASAYAQTDKKPDAKPESKPEPKKEEAKPAAASVKEVAVLKTSAGEMVIEFWPDVAPKTVENFKTLAKKGFYDGTAFHRIIKGFMIQGGDPNTKDPAKEDSYGKGDPGYKIKAEFNQRSHLRGVVSMARSGDPLERQGLMPRPEFADSAGSQFFICLGDASFLDRKYTAFGILIKGDDVLGKLGDVPTGGPERSRPAQRQELISVKIVPVDSLK